MNAPDQEDQVETRSARYKAALVIREADLLGLDLCPDLGFNQLLQHLSEHRLEGDRTVVRGGGRRAATFLDEDREAGFSPVTNPVPGGVVDSVSEEGSNILTNSLK